MVIGNVSVLPSPQVMAQQERQISDSDLGLIKQLCLPNKIISGNLEISPAAVSMQITRIGDKLGVENRTAIVIKALKLGLVNLDQLVYRSYNGGTHLP